MEDAVDAFLLAAVQEEANGKIFNLGGEQTISLKELARLLVEVNGAGTYTIRSFPSDRKRIDIGDYYADFNAIQSTLNWQPRIPLAQGLRQTLVFYAQNLPYYL